MTGEVDMSPQAISRRLAEVSRLREVQKASRPAVDMSPQAITRRLELVSQLRSFCLELAAIGKANGL